MKLLLNVIDWIGTFCLVVLIILLVKHGWPIIRKELFRK